MKVRRYEGGIPYEMEVPDPAPGQLAAFLRATADHCSCRGEAHDECRPDDDDEACPDCRPGWRCQRHVLP